MDPYSVQSGLACIPDLNDFPSFKTLVIARGTFNVGDQQVGYIFMNPRCSASTSASTFRFTTAAYLGATVDLSISTTGVFSSAFAAMPFTGPQVDAPGGVLARTVGCGLRIRYTGTELNRSGRLIPYRSQALGQGTPVSGSFVSTYLNRPEIPSVACTRRWHSVNYLPANNLGLSTGSAYEYLNSLATDNTVSTTGIGLDLGWIVDGATKGNGFEWECYIHKEYVSATGTFVPPNTSASHSDMPGLSAVRNAVEAQVPVGDGPSLYDRALKYIESFTPEDMSHVSERVMGAYTTANRLGWI